PLTPVMAALDTLDANGLGSTESTNSLAMIRRNVELESQLIDDLLDLTRIAKDKLQLRFGPLDAHEVINSVVVICRPEAQVRNLTLHLNLRGGSHHVSGDAAKFQQIVWNLLKNAIKFTADNGEITISSYNPVPESRPLRILLVDDHQDTCTALERLLVRRGHLVAAAHNVRSAMEAAAGNTFDLLISDIALPDGTGTELMTYLHAISQIPGIA